MTLYMGMKYVTLMGMSRSGNHAVERWLTAHYEQAGYNVYFQNNVTKAFLDHVKFLMHHVDRSTRNVYLVSLEDDNAVANEALSVLTSVADRNILLLRDPLNLFASRIRGLGPPRGLNLGPDAPIEEVESRVPEVTSAIPTNVGWYLNHHREFEGGSRFLANKVCISYNRWVVDRGYRKGIIEDGLGLKFSDAGHELRVDSSFGEKRWADADYFSRWRDCWDMPVYAPIRGDSRLLEISRGMGVEV